MPHKRKKNKRRLKLSEDVILPKYGLVTVIGFKAAGADYGKTKTDMVKVRGLMGERWINADQ